MWSPLFVGLCCYWALDYVQLWILGRIFMSKSGAKAAIFRERSTFSTAFATNFGM